MACGRRGGAVSKRAAREAAGRDSAGPPLVLHSSPPASWPAGRAKRPPAGWLLCTAALRPKKLASFHHERQRSDARRYLLRNSASGHCFVKHNPSRSSGGHKQTQPVYQADTASSTMHVPASKRHLWVAWGEEPAPSSFPRPTGPPRADQLFARPPHPASPRIARHGAAQHAGCSFA
jgi:hypothetical protein